MKLRMKTLIMVGLCVGCVGVMWGSKEGEKKEGEKTEEEKAFESADGKLTEANKKS